VFFNNLARCQVAYQGRDQWCIYPWYRYDNAPV
jgi:hypothetical protein